VSQDDSGSSELTNSYDSIPSRSINEEQDRVLPRQIPSGMARGVQMLGSDQVYSDSGNRRIIVAENSTPKVLMGNQPTFGQGFYVAKEGIDATTNTDPNGWIFNSNQNIFKIIKKIPTTTPTYTTTFGGTYTTGGTGVTVPHGQTFTPIVQAYCQAQLFSALTFTVITSSYIPLPLIQTDNSFGQYFLPNSTGSAAYGGISVLFGVDATNVYITVAARIVGNFADTMASIPITIFLLQESAAMS
jgi:hypothetical protein